MISTSLLTEFKTLLGKENVMDSESDRHAYSYDAAVLDAVIPELVLRPTNSEQRLARPLPCATRTICP